jgi:hypothetical protein
MSNIVSFPGMRSVSRPRHLPSSAQARVNAIAAKGYAFAVEDFLPWIPVAFLAGFGFALVLL